MKIRELQTPAELDNAYSILRELRPHVGPEAFREIYRAAHAADGYRFYGAFEEASCIGVMGARVLHDYVHGKHFYIDDLIVSPAWRSKGAGAEFLRFAETKARELACAGLRLCTGTDNREAIRFYEREGWKARAFAFKKSFLA